MTRQELFRVHYYMYIKIDSKKEVFAESAEDALRKVKEIERDMGNNNLIITDLKKLEE